MTPAGAPKEWPFDLAVRICKLMSVAAGTVIEWVVATGLNAQGERTRTVHSARRTKPFCSLAVAPIKEFSYEANTRMLQEFLQHGLDQFKNHDWRKMNGLIAAFLDARLEYDYAEARGIKTVVVLEMLKDLFVDEYSEKVWEPMLPQALRRKIGTVIKTALKESDDPPEAVGAVRDKLGQWDPSFRRVVLYMIEQLGLVEDEKSVKAIVASRNSLVHTGQFLSVKDPAKGKDLGFADAGHEFFSLLSFVDRILLRIVGHLGMYTNLFGVLDEPLRASHGESTGALSHKGSNSRRPFLIPPVPFTRLPDDENGSRSAEREGGSWLKSSRCEVGRCLF